MNKLQNYIGGKLQAPIGNKYLENINPSKGEVYSFIPDSDKSDVDLAVQHAQKAFPVWSSYSAKKRSDILLKLSNLIEANLDSFAEAESIDNGKPLWLAKKVDIPRAASNFHFFATAINHFASDAHITSDSVINFTIRHPLGIVGCISPWNLPLYLFSWKIAPALAAGNCVIAKPSEVTPVTAYLLSKLCIEAGLPEGVLNIIHGLGSKVGVAITEHPEICAISFTGGTATGEQIAKTAAPKFKKLSLELGGKNPTIIFDDCNFDKTVSEVVRSSFSNQGQICLCGSRIFVQEGIYEKFKEAYVNKVSNLKVSNPNDPKANLGAIVSKPHMEKVLSYIDLAKKEGGKILTGGNQVKLNEPYSNGYYIKPTVIEGLNYLCRTNQEEIFGPVVTIMPFKDKEHVIEMANSSEYGLASSIWTENINTAQYVGRKVKCGIIWINCWLLRDLRTPFGGMRNSGVGREGGWEALRFFTEPQNICINQL